MSVFVTNSKQRLSEEFFENFQDREYREAYGQAEIASMMALQILLNREARDLSQEQLADLADMTQSSISRLEDPTYGRYSIRTLQRIARAFDFALQVKFVPYSDLALAADIEGAEQFVVASFEDDTLARPEDELVDAIRLIRNTMVHMSRSHLPTVTSSLEKGNDSLEWARLFEADLQGIRYRVADGDDEYAPLELSASSQQRARILT